MSAQDTFSVAGRTFVSRLLVGTGKYKDMDETRDAIAASGAEIITIAVRRTNIGQNSDEPNILEILPPDRYTIPPTRPVAMTPRQRSGPAAWHASCSMDTTS